MKCLNGDRVNPSLRKWLPVETVWRRAYSSSAGGKTIAHQMSSVRATSRDKKRTRVHVPSS